MNGNAPECWSWDVPELKTVDYLIRADACEPDPNRRRGAATIRWFSRHPEAFQSERFSAFHASRCAICGCLGEHLIVDHDHETGQVRGNLCASCNVLEGRSDAPVFEMYRRIHPAAILDYHRPYTGFGWQNGWCLAEVRSAVRDLGRRPATPWPVWSREDAYVVGG